MHGRRKCEEKLEKKKKGGGGEFHVLEREWNFSRRILIDRRRRTGSELQMC